MRERRDSRVLVAGMVWGVSMLAVVGGCANSSKSSSTYEADRLRAAELGLSSEAEDPTARNDRLGYGRWRQAPEPEGTAAPAAPERRNSPWENSWDKP